MNYGFSGTREGMTAQQKTAFRELLLNRGKPDYFHHGGCVGADDEASAIVEELWGSAVLHAHLSTLINLRSKDAFIRSMVWTAQKPPLNRNRDIVDCSGLLIACPKTAAEKKLSDTWATIRYARKKKIGVIIITPDGYFLEDES